MSAQSQPQAQPAAASGDAQAQAAQPVIQAQSQSAQADASGAVDKNASADDSKDDKKKKVKAKSKHYATLKNGADSTDDLQKSMDKMKLQKDEKKPAAAINYAAERVIGNGAFGTVYEAVVQETGETVAIKKVLQDKRFKNRELQIMKMLDHTNVTTLKHCFYSKGEKADEVFLNLVMEFIPETLHKYVRSHTKSGKSLPMILVKTYMYQICRGLAYIHSLGICHRDIKPQNVLLNTKTHVIKLCDFGSAKILVKGEPNVAYICSRYYRAPELVFEATEYTTAIDIWSIGCVLAEMIIGTPLFPGESSVDQLIEIIKVLGTPTSEEIQTMNPSNNKSFKFPQIKPHPWAKVLRGKATDDAISLVSMMLRYKPNTRVLPFEALAHPFFDELREENVKLPDGAALPELFNFTEKELAMAKQLDLSDKLIPKHLQKDVDQKSQT